MKVCPPINDSMFVFNFSGDDNPKQLTIQPNEVTVARSDGTEDKYPLVIECEPTSCTSVLCHPNEGFKKLFTRVLG